MVTYCALSQCNIALEETAEENVLKAPRRNGAHLQVSQVRPSILL